MIRSIDRKKIKGWILDLRENTGGNCWPMLAGLGPLLGNGICGYFIDVNNNKSAWYYNNGSSGSNGNKIVSVSNKPYVLRKRNPRIAVLTGPMTASSGEVVVTAFRGKNNTKSFGENTAGFSTGNVKYTLSDGSMILLTTSVYADRDGIAYGKEIQPDVMLKLETSDDIIKHASNWIKKQ